jgi:hypothetical protein
MYIFMCANGLKFLVALLLLDFFLFMLLKNQYSKILVDALDFDFDPESMCRKLSITLKSSSKSHTDKKENQSFLIYKEIQSGAVAKSYMRKGFLIYGEIKKSAQIFPLI